MLDIKHRHRKCPLKRSSSLCSVPDACFLHLPAANSSDAEELVKLGPTMND